MHFTTSIFHETAQWRNLLCTFRPHHGVLSSSHAHRGNEGTQNSERRLPKWGLFEKLNQTGPWGWCTQEWILMGCPSPRTSFCIKTSQKQHALCLLLHCWMFHRLQGGKVQLWVMQRRKHVARSCGAYKPEIAFLKYFGFSNPLNLTSCSKDTLTITLRFHICEAPCFWVRLLPEKKVKHPPSRGFHKRKCKQTWQSSMK